MQAQYYEPVIGRFYSNDPIGFVGDVHSFNRYAYVANNPYKLLTLMACSKVVLVILTVASLSHQEVKEVMKKTMTAFFLKLIAKL
ncbi:RHS repeat-associated core domain-containing protein [Thalassotalea sp. 1_MG-2023]|nr:RHS repeat-associated core domain-containing protein [Thalassotalea sp. 1_MG-2023]MDO6428033.1 RHS repeat-associated core domain-containing protein [Thalassotalea sp. 1_MG-2023]